LQKQTVNFVSSSVPEEYRTVNPGSVEAIQENPQNKEQVMK
jgi:hypothetical protein